MPDQRLCTAVTEMVHFLMTEHHEESTEGARSDRRILHLLNLAAVSAELAQQCQAVGPHRGVFSIHSRVQSVGLHLECDL